MDSEWNYYTTGTEDEELAQALEISRLEYEENNLNSDSELSESELEPNLLGLPVDPVPSPSTLIAHQNFEYEQSLHQDSLSSKKFDLFDGIEDDDLGLPGSDSESELELELEPEPENTQGESINFLMPELMTPDADSSNNINIRLNINSSKPIPYTFNRSEKLSVLFDIVSYHTQRRDFEIRIFQSPSFYKIENSDVSLEESPIFDRSTVHVSF